MILAGISELSWVDPVKTFVLGVLIPGVPALILILKHRLESKRFQQEATGGVIKHMGEIVTASSDLIGNITQERERTAAEFASLLAYERSSKEELLREHGRQIGVLEKRLRDRDDTIVKLISENARLSDSLEVVSEISQNTLDDQITTTYSDA